MIPIIKLNKKQSKKLDRLRKKSMKQIKQGRYITIKSDEDMKKHLDELHNIINKVEK